MCAGVYESVCVCVCVCVYVCVCVHACARVCAFVNVVCMCARARACQCLRVDASMRVSVCLSVCASQQSESHIGRTPSICAATKNDTQMHTVDNCPRLIND